VEQEQFKDNMPILSVVSARTRGERFVRDEMHSNVEDKNWLRARILDAAALSLQGLGVAGARMFGIWIRAEWSQLG